MWESTRLAVGSRARPGRTTGTRTGESEEQTARRPLHFCELLFHPNSLGPKQLARTTQGQIRSGGKHLGDMHQHFVELRQLAVDVMGKGRTRPAFIILRTFAAKFAEFIVIPIFQDKFFRIQYFGMFLYCVVDRRHLSRKNNIAASCECKTGDIFN